MYSQLCASNDHHPLPKREQHIRTANIRQALVQKATQGLLYQGVNGHFLRSTTKEHPRPQRAATIEVYRQPSRKAEQRR
jgi:hypothetical protein